MPVKPRKQTEKPLCAKGVSSCDKWVISYLLKKYKMPDLCVNNFLRYLSNSTLPSARYPVLSEHENCLLFFISIFTALLPSKKDCNYNLFKPCLPRKYGTECKCVSILTTLLMKGGDQKAVFC